MSEKGRINIRLPEKTLSKLEEYAKENGESQTATIQKALDQFFNEEQEERIAELFLEKWDKKHGAEMVRLKFAATASEINSLILIEIFNSVLLKKGYSADDFTATDTINSGIVWKAKKHVKERLARYKQYKDNSNGK